MSKPRWVAFRYDPRLDLRPKKLGEVEGICAAAALARVILDFAETADESISLYVAPVIEEARPGDRPVPQGSGLSRRLTSRASER